MYVLTTVRTIILQRISLPSHDTRYKINMKVSNQSMRNSRGSEAVHNAVGDVGGRGVSGIPRGARRKAHKDEMLMLLTGPSVLAGAAQQKNSMPLNADSKAIKYQIICPKFVRAARKISSV